MGIMITYRGYDNPGIMYTEPWIHIIHGKIQYSQQVNAKAVWGGIQAHFTTVCELSYGKTNMAERRRNGAE